MNPARAGAAHRPREWRLTTKEQCHDHVEVP